MRRSGRSRSASHGFATAAGAIRTRGGIAQRMVLATVALALVVGAVFATLLLTIEDARSAQRSALHSQDVLIAANGLELRVLDVETGQRGFILTRQANFLTQWQQARTALPGEGEALLKLVAGDPAQEARTREIEAKRVPSCPSARNSPEGGIAMSCNLSRRTLIKGAAG